MTSPETKIKVNFFGVGCNIVRGNVNESTWKKITQSAKTLNIPTDYAFFDSDFFTLLNLPEYKSWKDFNNLFKVFGLLENQISLIEIRKDRKRAEKFSFAQLWNQNSLFPLYQTEINGIDIIREGKNITVVETEIGTIASYEFVCENFKIEDLKFNISQVKVSKQVGYNLISDIFYKDKKLKSKRSDALISGNFTFVE